MKQSTCMVATAIGVHVDCFVTPLRSVPRNDVTVGAVAFPAYVDEGGVDDQLVELAVGDEDAYQLVQLTLHY